MSKWQLGPFFCQKNFVHSIGLIIQKCIPVDHKKMHSNGEDYCLNKSTFFCGPENCQSQFCKILFLGGNWIVIPPKYHSNIFKHYGLLINGLLTYIFMVMTGGLGDGADDIVLPTLHQPSTFVNKTYLFAPKDGFWITNAFRVGFLVASGSIQATSFVQTTCFFV